MQHENAWHFWIDRGGTFTDVVALSPGGEISTRKLLSSCPERYDDAAIQGIRDFLALAPGEPIRAQRVASVKMGTTVATNALLERRGAEVVLVVTEGFRDLLRIGSQNRPRLFDRHIVLPDRLERRTVEVLERVDVAGRVLKALDAAHAMEALRAAYRAGCRAVAIALMHGYRYPAHEEAIAEIAAEIGFEHISVSNRVSPLMKIVGRADTTLVDAYLSPVLDRYVRQVGDALGAEVPLAFMQSNGGLMGAGSLRGCDAILSGPAGGIVGMVETAKAAGFTKIIGFDMGGTSTDVSHYAGVFERSLETVVAGVRLRVPMLQATTIAAGGGSICRFDGTRLRVGPDSAGADPGPACYRRGGPLTVTDCNVMLGKLQPDCFPRLFGPDGDAPIDPLIVRQKFEALADEIVAAGLPRSTPERLAEGFVAIANDSMANAIKTISVAQGHDVTGYVLACFGGAAGQHACLVADALGMRQVMVHPLAGVLSAYGIGLADQRILRQRTIEMPLDAAGLLRAAEEWEKLQEECLGLVSTDGFETDALVFPAQFAVALCQQRYGHRGGGGQRGGNTRRFRRYLPAAFQLHHAARDPGRGSRFGGTRRSLRAAARAGRQGEREPTSGAAGGGVCGGRPACGTGGGPRGLGCRCRCRGSGHHLRQHWYGRRRARMDREADDRRRLDPDARGLKAGDCGRDDRTRSDTP